MNANQKYAMQEALNGVSYQHFAGWGIKLDEKTGWGMDDIVTNPDLFGVKIVEKWEDSTNDTSVAAKIFVPLKDGNIYLGFWSNNAWSVVSEIPEDWDLNTWFDSFEGFGTAVGTEFSERELPEGVI